MVEQEKYGTLVGLLQFIIEYKIQSFVICSNFWMHV